MKRGILFSVLSFMLMTQYMNCSSYSDSTFDASTVNLSSTDDTTSFEGLKAMNGETYMVCNEDHVQIGGTCNTGDAADNFIESRITRERVTQYWGSGSTKTDHLKLSRCENGRFFAIIPKPNDSALAVSGSDYIEYQIHFRLFTSADKLQYKAGQKAPNFNIYIQKNGGCK